MPPKPNRPLRPPLKKKSDAIEILDRDPRDTRERRGAGASRDEDGQPSRKDAHPDAERVVGRESDAHAEFDADAIE